MPSGSVNDTRQREPAMQPITTGRIAAHSPDSALGLILPFLKRCYPDGDLFQFIQQLVPDSRRAVGESRFDVGLGNPAPECGRLLVRDAVSAGINRPLMRLFERNFA